ncbi:MAG: penicillin acylase family protein [Actinobacteria bacterium]|nr:penicillin acylase family protein [Actinomycetota bacterium]
MSVAVLLVGVGCTDSDDTGAATTVGSGSTYEATIRRTTGGVPHITASTLANASFGEGWASNEDRACDLADQVLKVRGERSRWFGAGEQDANINSDAAWLEIGIYRRAAADWQHVSKDLDAQITAYTAGWNAHLEAVGAKGIKGWCSGADWLQPIKPVDVYAYARSIALTASGSRLSSFIAGAHPPTEPPAATVTPSAVRPDGAAPSLQLAAAHDPVTQPSTPASGPAIDAASIGSNGWAIGAERSAEHRGMLLANPHFPWEGELRFWEAHLTIPGQLDAYGATLSGLPGLGIGFTKNFGWTHTVSAGNRFTAYRLTLVPGQPTKYRYGNEVRDLTPTEHSIEVLGKDGKLSTVKRTTWSSHYGPVLDFPGVGWTDQSTITYRDANIDNTAFPEQYLAFLKAKSLDQFIAAGRKINGVPLFNTIATSADGRAYYADWSATPNLSPEAIAAYDASLTSDPIVKLAADNGAVLLDGSDPRFEWVDAPGARSPGLVPADRQPAIERNDYVFNANDSFWMPNAKVMLEGDYTPLFGRQKTPRSPRTRENAVVLEDTSDTGPAGKGGLFTLDSLADASLANRGYTAQELLSQVVQRCTATPSVTVPALPAAAPPPTRVPGTPPPAPGLPAATVDVSAACRILAAWDSVYDLDRKGPIIWRETMSRYKSDAFMNAGALWATPFDPADPVNTPNGLAPATGGTDQVLVNLARAVQTLEAAGIPLDATLGDAQFAMRDGHRVPLHGGTAVDGVTNVVTWGSLSSSEDPAVLGVKRENVVAGSTLNRLDGQTGYPVNFGTSFLLALAYTDQGPKAKAFLTYSNTEDRKNPDYLAATEQFSAKRWRTVDFTEQQIKADTTSTVTVRG